MFGIGEGGCLLVFCWFFNIPFHLDVIWGKVFPSNKHGSICFYLEANILCTVLSFFKYLCSHTEMGKSA